MLGLRWFGVTEQIAIWKQQFELKPPALLVASFLIALIIVMYVCDTDWLSLNW